MVRVRKLVLAIAAASALTSGAAHALGLGEVTMRSALNQPLVAEIELLEVRGLGTEDVIPALASQEAFNRAGVDRQYFLTDLKFTPVIKPNGKSVIRVTSSKPVREPYLNFLVELHWPNGRLLREYTLLLDPPLYRPEPVLAAPVRVPVSAPSSTPVRSAPAPLPRPVASRAPTAAAPGAGSGSAPSRPAAPAQTDGTYRTSGADTLWDVAKRVPGGNANQAMLAIRDLNPDAFIGGNINRMKSGQVLRLPSEEQVRSRTAAEAQAQVAEQNAAWRERREVAAPARQLDATRRSTAGAAPARTEAADNLRLVAGESGSAPQGSDNATGTGSAGLEDKLAVAQESLESTRRENSELQARMTDLESRLEKMQRLVELKDDQLAKLQSELGAENRTDGASVTDAGAEGAPVTEAGADAAAPAATVETEVNAETETETGTAAVTDAPVAGESAPQAAVSPEADVAPTAETGEPALDAPLDASGAAAPQAGESDSLAEADQADAAPQAPTAPVVAETPAEPAAEPAAAKPTPATQAPAASGNFLDDLLQDSTVLTILGGGALVLLLIALMMLSRRNAQREAQLHESLAAQQVLDDNAVSRNDFDQEVDATDAELAEAAAQSGDALDEADIYIAYGRFNQAAELLQRAIGEEPERNELRLKLMEVYAELGDREGFHREESELREIGGSHPEIERLKARYPAMAGLAAGAVVGAATTTASLDEDFDLDDLDLDLDSTQPAASPELDDAFDLSLADLEADLETPAAAQPVELDDDLDLSMEFDAPVEPQPLVETDPLADFDLDFDASAISFDSAADQPNLDDDSLSSEFELPADFDLSLPEEAAADPASEAFLADLAAADAELNAFSKLDSDAVELEAAASTAEGDDDFDFLSGTDETATKLDLARAYIDMGDSEGARDILDEVLNEGSDVQQNEARELLARLV